MTTFIVAAAVSKTYGSKDIIYNIYEIQKETERPHKIAFIIYNTDSTCGLISEVFRQLIEIGRIPKKYYNYSKCDWRDSGYYCSEVEKAGYRIYELY